MATECRRTKRVNKQRFVRLLTVIAVLIATAFTIGRLTAPYENRYGDGHENS